VQESAKEREIMKSTAFIRMGLTHSGCKASHRIPEDGGQEGWENLPSIGGKTREKGKRKKRNFILSGSDAA